METRYALRELEGAIGRDCLRLEDGRRAEFRHTAIWRRARHDFFERKDIMLARLASVVISSSVFSRPSVSLDAAVDAAEESRMGLVKVAFPYLDISPKPRDYSKYFKMLDEMTEEKPGPNGAAGVGGEGAK